MDPMVPKVASSVLRDENCNGQACGICNTCRRQAATAIASYVIRKCLIERKQSSDPRSPEAREYVRNTVMRMLDVAGLLDKNELDIEEIKLLDWGHAMRSRQLGR